MEENMVPRPIILIIDDDTDFRKSIADVLHVNGYETVAAPNGLEGLSLAGRNPVNVAIIDLGLPDIPGIDVLRRIKTDSPMVEAIILTGNATMDSAIESTNLGACSYLLKPYDIDELLLHIGRAVDKQKSYEKVIRQSMEFQKIDSGLKELYSSSEPAGKSADMNELFSDLLHSLNMSLAGNIEDLGLGEILQIISLSRKSGILTLRSQGREGRIIFREGEVIGAVSPTFQECFGEMLVRKNLIDRAKLRSALSVQQRDGFKEKLGAILVNHYRVSAAVIERVVREQIENAVYSLFDWTQGTFDFELQDAAKVADTIEMDPMQFMLEQGLNPLSLALEGARIIDEKHHREEAGFLRALAPNPPGPEDGAELAISIAEPAMPPSSPVSSTEIEENPALVLVDDNAAIRDALVPCLRNSGYTVHPAAKSGDALLTIAALYRNGWRPIVLADLIMPRMDGTGMLGGVELLEQIRENFPDTPVLAMADYHNSEAEWKIRRMGFPLIMKPRNNEIGNGIFLQAFAERLLNGLDQVRSGGGPAEWIEKENADDAPRRETAGASRPASGPVAQSTGITLLREMLEELNNPALGEGAILLILRYASEFVSRAVIFKVGQDEIVSLGQSGISGNGKKGDSEFKKLRVSRKVDSLFSRIIESRVPFKESPDTTLWNRYLFEQLGGGVPAEVFVGPIINKGEVVGLLYGDNVPENKPIGDTDSLEIFLSQAGRSLENALPHLAKSSV